MKLQDGDRLVTVQEAARLTERKVATWRKDIFLRKVPVVRIGRQVRIPFSAIQAMIQRGYSPAVSR